MIIDELIDPNLLNNIIYIGEGLGLTLWITIFSCMIGLTGGTFIAILRHNGILNRTIAVFISVIRGTPLFLQLTLFFFLIPRIFGVQVSVITSGIIALGANSIVYVAEIIRGGIASINIGQFEACKVLKIKSIPMWRFIIMPQVLRNVLPSVASEVITVLKESSLVSILGAMEMMRRSQVIASETYDYFTPILIAGAYYYIAVMFIEYCFRNLERKLSYGKN